MRILLVWPPVLPSYFNAGHRMAMYQVAAYLRRELQSAEVVVRDFGALNCTWKEVADCIAHGYDLIVIQNDFDAATGFGRFVGYCRQLCPGARILTFGRLSAQIPGFFARYGLDGAVASGDPEPAVLRYAQALAQGHNGVAIAGLAQAGRTPPPGDWLEPDEWALPDVRDIPLHAYHALYARDENKFCGIPGRTELVVPLARGCPVGCYFCEVPAREGPRDRRLAPAVVIGYAMAARKIQPFDYVSMYAPTFTLRQGWVRQLCAELADAGTPFLWKCTTTASHLSREIVSLMGQAGCVRISVGLETAEPAAQALLPALKQTPLASVFEINEWCSEAGIELTCFVVLGLPGTNARQTQSLVCRMQDAGIRIRPTVYADYSQLHPNMTEAQVDALNRQVHELECSEEDRQVLYAIYFGNFLAGSSLSSRIPAGLAY
ncbi:MULTISPECIES: B12-binding domain-containing radical SAM protein [Burkholderia cepacia complex]|nr:MULTISPECIES: radical SAM protein [Burkholderia cepacia complex]MBR8290502.1 radical SAM protein [Burkholderia cenocepacia]